jgi:CO/xanthine dehydrogenase FAD-binding subunit
MLFRKLHPFDYHEPDTLQEACEVLASPDAKATILAGGVSLIDQMKRGMQKPDVILSLHRIKDLRFLDAFDGALGIGALATLKDGERSPLLQKQYGSLWDAVSQIGSVQVKTMGTIVGNVTACNPASDVATALTALGAEIKVAGRERSIPIESFGVDVRKNCLKSHEIVTEIRVPAPEEGSVAAFLNLARTKEDIAKVAVGVHAVVRGGVVEAVRIALGAVAPIILRASVAENILKGESPSLTVIEAAAKAAAESEGVVPITDLRSTAEYRREMVAVLTQRALLKALDISLN